MITAILQAGGNVTEFCRMFEIKRSWFYKHKSLVLLPHWQKEGLLKCIEDYELYCRLRRQRKNSPVSAFYPRPR